MPGASVFPINPDIANTDIADLLPTVIAKLQSDAVYQGDGRSLSRTDLCRGLSEQDLGPGRSHMQGTEKNLWGDCSQKKNLAACIVQSRFEENLIRQKDLQPLHHPVLHLDAGRP